MSDGRVATLLAHARKRISARDARVLLANVLDKNAEWLITHDNDQLSKELGAQFQSLVDRRAAGEPLAYLTGTQEFFGRRFEVSPATLIPRCETEFLVELGLKFCTDKVAPRLLELGTGCAAIAITLALENPKISIVAIEKSWAALEIARENANSYGVSVQFIASDWYAALDEAEQFDVIIANPPYVATNYPKISELVFEPSTALIAGAEGLDDLKKIIAGAGRYLAHGACLMVEHGYDQASAVAKLFEASGFTAVECLRDYALHPRITSGRWKAVITR